MKVQIKVGPSWFASVTLLLTELAKEWRKDVKRQFSPQLIVHNCRIFLFKNWHLCKILRIYPDSIKFTVIFLGGFFNIFARNCLKAPCDQLLFQNCNRILPLFRYIFYHEVTRFSRIFETH